MKEIFYGVTYACLTVLVVSGTTVLAGLMVHAFFDLFRHVWRNR